MRRSRTTMIVAAGAALTMVLTACGGGGGASGGVASKQAGQQDFNARDVSTLKDGGDLRIPVDNLPDNWNTNQVDGTLLNAQDIEKALYPWAFIAAPDGTPLLQTDYFTSANVTSTDPEVVTYTINPKATWDSGRPITWEDLDAQFKALNGTNPAYQVSGTTGYESVASVTRGVDDKQAVVTFKQKYGEWESLFSPLLPKETNADVNAFNTGWVDKPLDTAGSFKVGTIDKTAKTITMVRDEKWWGEKPKLDRIIVKVTERAALADALANNEIDFYKIGSSVDLLKRAQAIPGVTVRRAPELTYSHMTFNGAPSSILSDVKLRQAVAKGIDCAAVVQRAVGQVSPTSTPVGNHFYQPGTKYYRDNSAVTAYNPQAAASELDALGWTLQGAVRKKDGKELDLRLVESSPNPIAEIIDKTVLDQLGKIGVKVTIQQVPTANYFKDYVNTGNFDITGFVWGSTPSPLGGAVGIYQTPSGDNVRQNYGRVATPEIDKELATALAELDPDKRAALTNDVDLKITEQVHDVQFYAGTGATAVRDTVANLESKGYGDYVWTKVGFIQ